MYSEHNSMGFIIHRSDSILKNFFHSKIKSFNLTREQWIIISWLYDEDGINQKELAEKTLKDPASLARTLDRMEKSGFIRRERDSQDRRAFLIYLTEFGYKVRKEIEPIAVRCLEESFKNFSIEEIETLKKLLLKIEV